MSATFGLLGERVAGLLGDKTKVIRSEGRCFPVEVKFRGGLRLNNWEPKGPWFFADVMAKAIEEALEAHPGDMLVFLPGEREIMYTWIVLNNMGIGDGEVPKNLVGWARSRIKPEAVDLSRKLQCRPLYSTMEQHEQDEVVSPPPEGWRKVILATPIAESSITVPGIRIVVDSGLRRMKREDPKTCVSDMVTLPVSKSSADQRCGRAGRTSTGVCIRLWDEKQHVNLKASDAPEIHRTDLSGCVLDLAQGGYLSDADIVGLPWVDAPTPELLDMGRQLLARLRALEARPGSTWALTERGRQFGRYPLSTALVAHGLAGFWNLGQPRARRLRPCGDARGEGAVEGRSQ